MSEKKPKPDRKISPRETVVLDDDELAELDDASLTGVMRELTSTLQELDPENGAAEDDDEMDFGSLDKADPRDDEI